MGTWSRRTAGDTARMGGMAALSALAMVAALSMAAEAGQPAALSDDTGGSSKPVSAFADSVRKAKAAALTTTKTPAKVTPTVAKLPAGAKRVPTAAKVAPAPAFKGGAPASVARIPAGAKSTRTVAVIPAGAKTPPPVKVIPAAAAASIARVAPNQGASGPTLAKSGGTTVKAPASSGAGKSVNGVSAQASVSKSVGVPAPIPLEDHVTYQYNALGRRDPFQSLMEGVYVGADEGGQAPPDLGGLKLMGIVWGSSDQFAMVEDVRGNSYVLRRGDRVMNGFVEGLKRDGMMVNITVDGQSQSVLIPITRKGDKSNANR